MKNIYTVETYDGKFFVINDIEEFVLKNSSLIGTEFIFIKCSFENYDKNYRDSEFVNVGYDNYGNINIINCFYVITRNGKVYDPAWLITKYYKEKMHPFNYRNNIGSKNEIKASKCKSWCGFANPKNKRKGNLSEFKQLIGFKSEYSEFNINKSGRIGDVKYRFVTDLDYYDIQYTDNSWKKNAKVKKQWMRHKKRA